MVWKAICVKQGDLCGRETRTGVRAFIVVMKRRNGRGAKGGREVDALLSGKRHIHRHKLALWPITPETSALLGRTNRFFTQEPHADFLCNGGAASVLLWFLDALSFASSFHYVGPLVGEPPTGEPYAGGSGRQGCNLAGESPAVSIAHFGHVAMPHPGLGNRSGDAWCKWPGRPAYCMLRWVRSGGLASAGA
jgi:hypothetical protein